MKRTLLWSAPVIFLATAGWISRHPRSPTARLPSRLIDALPEALEVPATPPARAFLRLGAMPADVTTPNFVIPVRIEPRRFFVVRMRVKRGERPRVQLNALKPSELEGLGSVPRALDGEAPGTPLGPCAWDEGSGEWATCQRLDRLGAAESGIAIAVHGAPSSVGEVQVLDAELPDRRTPPVRSVAELVRFSPAYTTTGINWRRAMIGRPGDRYVFRAALAEAAELWVGLGHEQGVDAAPVRFVVKQDERTVLDETLPANVTAWKDLHLPLEARQESILSFETFPVPGATGQARGLWADPRLFFERKAPSILLVTIDALRADHLGAYGYPRDTSPTIDLLAQHGVKFERATAQAPNTWISTLAMLTGRLPSTSGVDARGVPPDPGIPFLPDLFAKAGYDTFAGTDLAIFPPQYLSSFDELDRVYDPGPGHKPSPFPKFEELAKRMAARPTFTWIHLENPHYPLVPTEPLRYSPDYRGRFARAFTTEEHSQRAPLGSYTPEEKLHIEDLYDASVRDADTLVHFMLKALDESGALENTIVVVTADHGEMIHERNVLLDHGWIYEPVLHVPLIIVYPNRTPAMTVSQRVQNVDLAPTLLAMAGLPKDEMLDGRDLTPLWNGGRVPDVPIYVSGGHDRLAVQYDGSYKLIFRPEARRIGQPEYLLFDVLSDPQEEHDLAGDEKLLSKLRSELEAKKQSWATRPPGPGSGQLTQASLDALRQAGYLQDAPQR